MATIVPRKRNNGSTGYMAQILNQARRQGRASGVADIRSQASRRRLVGIGARKNCTSRAL